MLTEVHKTAASFITLKLISQLPISTNNKLKATNKNAIKNITKNICQTEIRN